MGIIILDQMKNSIITIYHNKKEKEEKENGLILEL